MKRKNLIYLIIIIMAALLVTGYLILRAYSPRYNWSENLKSNNKQPYGLSLLYELLQDSYKNKSFTELKNGDFGSVLHKKTDATYLYIGTNYYIDSANVIDLLDFAYRGNKVFISSTNDIDNFIKYWLNENSLMNEGHYIAADTIETRLYIPNSAHDSTYNFYYQYLKETTAYPWRYLNPIFVNHFPRRTRIVSTIDNNMVNFIAIHYGRGVLYFHADPIFFSNYHLTRKQTYAYIEAVFDEVLNDEVIWDNYSSTPFNHPRYSHFKESPLRYVLNNRSLRWAWYIVLAGSLLFIILQSRRKQQTIPMVEKKENNTLEYAKAIGSLYYRSKGYKDICTEMMEQLNNFIKLRYNIKLDQKKDPEAIEALSRASGIEKKKLEELFQLAVKLKFDETAESEKLFTLYNSVTYFYKNCH